MNSILRGFFGVTKTPLRSILTVVVLSITIAFALIMFIASATSNAHILHIKQTVGTNLTLNKDSGNTGPNMNEDGSMETSPMAGDTGDPLTDDDLKKIESVPHIVRTEASILVRGPQPMKEATDEEKARYGLTPLTPEDMGGKAIFNGKKFRPTYADITGIRGRGEKTLKGSCANQSRCEIEGRDLQEGDSRKALMTRKLAEKNHLSPGDSFKLYGQDFELIGIAGQSLGEKSEMGDQPRIVIPLKDLQELSGIKGYTEVSAIVDNVDNIGAVEKSVEATLPGIQVVQPAEDSKALTTGLGSIQGFIVFGFVSSLVASGLVIFFLMFLLVRNRRREVGIFKAIGGKTRALVSQFSTEGLALVMLASAAALALTYSMADGLTRSIISSVKAPGSSHSMTNGAGASQSVDPHDIMVDLNVSLPALMVVLVITVIAVSIPVAQAARVRPIEAMRQE